MIKRVVGRGKKAARATLAGLANPRRTVRDLKTLVSRRATNKERERAYLRWFASYEKQASDIQAQKKAIRQFKNKPLISIIVPFYNTPEPYFRACIQSVIDQSYTNWELCVADDASTTPAIEVVKEFAKKHPNIKWTRLETNQHIAASSNEALKLAKR